MTGEENALYDTLREIDELAEQAITEHGEEHEQEASGRGPGELLTCTPKGLPERLLVQSAVLAYTISPVNAPSFTAFAQPGAGFQPMEPERIAVLTSKYWGPKVRRLTVSFMEPTPQELRQRIIDHMNAWRQTTGTCFIWTAGTGQVRISRGGGGYYSYLGTDILLIPKNRQTMNLQGFDMDTPESEYTRVIRHETGHTLGCPHEHMRAALVSRIDPEKAYAYFWRTQRWDRATVDAQVLTSLDERSLMATPPDETSIMCYQLPRSITRDGKPIIGGTDITPNDFAFMGKVYPKPSPEPGDKPCEAEEAQAVASDDAWDESEDVNVDLDELYG